MTAIPLVLVHGHPFDHTMWRPQIEAFSASRPVLAPDLRGYGTAPGGAPVELFEDFAEDIEALLDEQGVPACVLAGLSMGGQIVMDCYRRFPGRIRGLVLADTFAAVETPEGVRARHAMADRLLREGMHGYADEVLGKMVAPYASPEVRAHVHGMMTATRPESAAAALRARAARPDYRELLTRVTVPALVTVGADDTYTPVADAEAMHTLLPDSELHVIKGAAHLPNLERAAEFNTVLGRFLAKVDARS
ncbi:MULTISPECIES: alpha/beta hydrolase [unclassified Streptomyces]|uniref:alpha/beta fold hydrolase n=1 Tax=unclassified Streptomyces TaxID=2593676 RepID=UPI000F4F422C|nr:MULTISPECIES: alpha/beta hydrolase [unclassified Streptomyces]MDH6451526.1 pimeloyl-ACP methyl ester carboxylesterase [Streptomyces sp. SAI-119]MDH6497916.1 pimeloyl-ACP methyl ester carboxylesterase [Streptomyces sp. SAI-149]QUC55400.1 alpha/beta fold hydrolase [Streptomyces sp. A2-16]